MHTFGTRKSLSACSSPLHWEPPDLHSGPLRCKQRACWTNVGDSQQVESRTPQVKLWHNLMFWEHGTCMKQHQTIPGCYFLFMQFFKKEESRSGLSSFLNLHMLKNRIAEQAYTRKERGYTLVPRCSKKNNHAFWTPLSFEGEKKVKMIMELRGSPGVRKQCPVWVVALLWFTFIWNVASVCVFSIPVTYG